jgi:hypothetical protein
MIGSRRCAGRRGLRAGRFGWYLKNCGPEVNLFVDHSQIGDLACPRAGIGVTKSLGTVLTPSGHDGRAESRGARPRTVEPVGARQRRRYEREAPIRPRLCRLRAVAP